MLSARKHWLALGLAAVLLLPGCWVVNFNPFTAEQEVSDTFKTTATPRIVVDTFNGAIDVTPGEKGIVEARVTKRAGGSTQEEAEQDLENIEVTMKQDGDKIEIKVGKTDQSMFSNRGASVDLQVPEGTVLDVRTTNGKVNVVAVTGNVKARSSNGAIHVKGSRGKLDLTTSNGGIQAEGGAGRLDLKTSNGPIAVKSTKAVVNARTSNGAIQFTGRLNDGDNSFQSSNGKIALALPSDAEFSLDATTSNGRIKSDFTVDEEEKASKHRLRGAVGKDPKATIKVHTNNGSIEIREQKGE
jgi:Putative adhesin